MKFEKFKKCIESIEHTYEKEETVSKCIEQNLATNTFCIVNISEEVISSLEEMLADYYDCYYEILNHTENDISWWLNAEERVVYIQNEDGKETEIHLEDVYAFWKYLEDNLKQKKTNKKGKNKKDAK